MALLDQLLRAWNHSDRLFNVLLEATADERIPLDVRVELINKTREAIRKTETTK